MSKSEFHRNAILFACIFALFCATLPAPAQTLARRPLITGRIDEGRLSTLDGNTRPQARAAIDRGPAEDDFPLKHMVLQLKRSEPDEQALRDHIDSLHDPASPNFHRWMTPDDFATAYGPAPEDRQKVVDWLVSHRFTIDSTGPGGSNPAAMNIIFSGTAGQVRDAFHTTIHHLEADSVHHIANLTDPQIPEALAPVVAGVVSLHDFFPRSMKRDRANYTYTSFGSTYQAVTPGDLAVIYNLNPLFSAGLTGKGQTIAVIEDSDLYSSADWTTFRSTFGLNAYTSGALTTVHPNNCAAPGHTADDGEAILDAEWASAAAPDAAIQVASCVSTRTTWGGLLALQGLVNSPAHPSVISISYGDCESDNGAAANAAFNAIYQQAVAEGISIFVSSGDEGAASCDSGATSATHGITISGFASTPYNVAVGGTDFADTLAGAATQYWSKTNSSTFVSALSYIPEVPWNDSCANSLLAGYLGYDSVYGAAGLCSSFTALLDGLLTVVAGSGGPSSCATGVGGTCKGYAKPSWQAGASGNPPDSVRDIPDVSLFAGNGLWGHYYVLCWSDILHGGARCGATPGTWSGAGGTSFGSPIMAGIQALVNQKKGAPQGNPNYVYYAFAKGTNSAGIFHSVTSGDNAVNCGGTKNCYGASGSSGRGFRFLSYDGALSTSSQSFTPAFQAAAGWNFATGLGTLNAATLVNNW